MILFIIKLISSIRKAIAGRRHPSQLAWGLALGVLLGLIPHGNLLTVALVLVVLMLQVNHAMVALVGIGLTFVAPKLDPQFDAVGQWFFNQPQIAENMAKAWQMPLVPWTDLNNTVVMGSFLIGLAALLPIVMLTYPVFRRWALALDAIAGEESVSTEKNASTDPAADRSISYKRGARSAELRTDELRTDQPHTPLHRRPVAEPSTRTGADDGPMTASSGRVYDVRRIDAGEPLTIRKPTNSVPNPGDSGRSSTKQPAAGRPTMVAINAVPNEPAAQPTNSAANTPAVPVDRAATAATKNSEIKVEADTTSADDQQKIDEALTYLLRQLRDSKDKDAA